MIAIDHLLQHLPGAGPQEDFHTLLQHPQLKIERIVSHGHATADGEWYDQDHDEWVLVIQGGAELAIETEQHRVELKPGDSLYLPAHCRHRVIWTDANQATVWLALHFTADTHSQYTPVPR